MSDQRAQQPSFDPRTWKRSTAPVPAPAAAPTPAPSAQRPAVPIAALGGSAAILLAAALWAWSSRPEGGTPLADPAPAPVAAPATPAGPRTERRMLALSGPGDLESALVASGVDAATAARAAALALPKLKPGEIRAKS